MRYTLFPLAFACLVLTSCSEWLSELGKAGPCAHTVLPPSRITMELAGCHRRGVSLDRMTAAESNDVALHLTAAVEKYVSKCQQKGTGFFRMEHVPGMLRAGEYRLQMVPFRAGERRLVLMNLIVVEKAWDTWRKQWVSMSDGGINNCRCIFDPATHEVLQLDSNGYG